MTGDFNFIPLREPFPVSSSAYRSLATSVSSAVLIVTLALPAHAQDAVAAQASEAASSETVLEPIVITGRKRTEREVDAPVSTVILKSERLAQESLDPGAAILRQTPNANFVDLSRPGDRYGTMRGIGPLGSPLNSLDSTVGFAVDGVPTSAFGFSQPLLDVDQVEVLRGPQGTLFGRNTLGGLVNVVGRAADGEREFRLNSEVGTDGHRLIEGIAAGWLLPDVLAGRGALRFQGFDGDIPNGIIGGKDGEAAIAAGRGTLRLTPDDSWQIDLTGSFSRDHRSNPVWLLKEQPGFPRSGSDIEPIGDRDIYQGTLSVRKEFETFALTSVTSYQHLNLESYDEFADSYIYSRWLGGTPDSWADPSLEKGRVKDREGLFNQEIRLNSLEDSPVTWVAGVNYFRSDYNTFRTMQSSLWPTANGTTDNDILSETWAVFGDISVPLDERWEVSGGLRLAHDRQRLDGRYVSNGFAGTVPSLTQSNEVSDTYMTGRAAISFKWTPDWMTYASIARGYSSGGFERTTQNAPYGSPADPFLPATGWTYEIGTKGMATDRLSLSASLFYNDITNGQLSAFDMTTYQVFFTNQDFRSYGFELGGAYELTDELVLTGGVGFTKSELVNVSALAGAGIADGNSVPQSPEWTSNLGIEYRKDMTDWNLDGTLFASVNHQYVGSRQTDVQNNIKLDPYHILNAKLGWENEDFGVYAFANNILDERPISYASAYGPGVTAVIAGRGRVLGLGASLKW